MSKVMLVMDKPETCLECRLCRELYEGIEACCELSDDLEDETLSRMIDVDYCQGKPVWCPLKELPKRRSHTTFLKDYSDHWKNEFNACIDEILKEDDKDE